jgi:hypothetical protein
MGVAAPPPPPPPHPPPRLGQGVFTQRPKEEFVELVSYFIEVKK